MNMISIEKAILADVCLGVPLGKIIFSMPSHLDSQNINFIPKTFIFRGEQLGLMKTLYQQGDEQMTVVVAELKDRADKALSLPPPAVVQKTLSRFSDDSHDYQSIAKYWWPNPETESGLPYVNRDGQVNPEAYSDDFDYQRLVQFSELTVLFALTSYLTGEIVYGRRCSDLLNAWFTDPETRQNPHFRFAQVCPGKDALRWQGVIEARYLIYVTEAVQLLSSIGALSSTAEQEVRGWFAVLLDWLLETSYGRHAKKAGNNIGFWYDLQCVVYAQFCGRTELADRIICEDVAPRLNAQMAADGALSSELIRSYPQDYVAFSLAAMVLISRMGEQTGLNLWNEQESDGRNFQVAHDWLLRAGNARKLLSKVEIDSGSRKGLASSVGLLLDTGVKLRTFQRIADAQARVSARVAAELASTKLLLEKRETEIATLKQLLANIQAEGDAHKPIRLDDTKKESKTEKQAVSKTDQSSTVDPLQMLLAAKPYQEEALKKNYYEIGLDGEPDTFVLYRIVGNDLYPRHKKGQSRTNVQFLLENEPELADCEKRWVVNRIIDPEEEGQIIGMLEAHGQQFVHIPFVADEYRTIGWDFDSLPAPGFLSSIEFQKLGSEHQDRVRAALYRLKNVYVMNNNGARNAALRAGRDHAKWVLPWDGNCFVTHEAWQKIKQAVLAKPHLRYFVVPMERVTDNAMLVAEDFTPYPIEEPQLLFRRDAGEEFNTNFPYGRRPKVELFWRLGIPGPWDRWKDDPWEQKRRDLSPEAHQFGVAGWVARMASGADALEQKDKTSFKNRGVVRREAIIATLDHVDGLVRRIPGRSNALSFYPEHTLDRIRQAINDDSGSLFELGSKILEDAERSLAAGPYSVVQKTTLPPSGNSHDYWHPAPYWWPDPSKPDGLPFIRKDGQRVPGTQMYEAASAQYDRTHLQLMFDGTTALALGWYITGRMDYAEHGAHLVRTWFLDPATRMNPHLRYAQVRRGRDNDEGAATGIIEFKDFYYFLDAVRLLEKSAAFRPSDSEGLKEWLRDYLAWLNTSKQGKKEVSASNNHGTYFDLQTASIAAYLGDPDMLRDIFLRTQTRITQQFTEIGEQPEEMKRTITQHYVFFNLQGWLNIYQIADTYRQLIGDWKKEPQKRVVSAFEWIMQHDLRNWPYEQIEVFDQDRVCALTMSALNVDLTSIQKVHEALGNEFHFENCKPIFHPDDAIHPYWNVGSPSSNLDNQTSTTKYDNMIGFDSAPELREIAFIIPVISKTIAPDWELIEKNLSSTIQSIQRSNNTKFQILICHQEKPDGSFWDDTRVISLPVPFAPEFDLMKGGRDKRRKHAYGAAWLKQNGWREGHIMLLDADDLVHQNLTQFLAENDHKACWIVTQGVRVDMAGKQASLLEEKFHHGCGSCFVGYFYAEDLPSQYEDKGNTFAEIIKKRHRDYGEAAKALGRECRDIPFPAIAYMTNHNASLQRLQTGKIDRRLAENSLLSIDSASGILSVDFGYCFDDSAQ